MMFLEQRGSDNLCFCLFTQTGDEDVKGDGNFYCTTCCRYFVSKEVQLLHDASKDHKQSLKRKKFDDDMDEREADALREYQNKRAKLTEITDEELQSV